MWYWDQIIQEKVEKAQEEGLFDNLRGAGKRQTFESSAHDESWLGNHLMNEAGVLPEWLQMRKDAYQLKPKLTAIVEEVRTRLEKLPETHWDNDAVLRNLIRHFNRTVGEYNAIINHHNHRCPSIAHELIQYRPDTVKRLKQRITQSRRY